MLPTLQLNARVCQDFTSVFVCLLAQVCTRMFRGRMGRVKLQNGESADGESVKALHTNTDFLQHSSQRSNFLVATMLLFFFVFYSFFPGEVFGRGVGLNGKLSCCLILSQNPFPPLYFKPTLFGICWCGLKATRGPVKTHSKVDVEIIAASRKSHQVLAFTQLEEKNLPGKWMVCQKVTSHCSKPVEQSGQAALSTIY